MFYIDTLYNDLLKLTEQVDSPFYYSDKVYDGCEFRVFTYRLASYQDFRQRNALECRGHTFERVDNKYVLSSLPMHKFFNNKENPFTMNLDFSETEIVYEKLDGSLISTVNSTNGMMLKSKTSFVSEHAEMARKILNSNAELREIVENYTNRNYTVNFEYISNIHRIVLPYEHPSLKVLNIRNNDTGEYVAHNVLQNEFSASDLVSIIPVSHIVEYSTVQTFVDSVHSMKGIEGYVIRLKDGSMVKLKTDEYVSLHHAKDSVTSPKRLMNVVLEEASDDLRQMFLDDAQALREIDQMEEFVTKLVNHLVKGAESFYEAHKSLERKDIAIKGQQELDRDQFSMVMGMYGGKEIDYKKYVMKNSKKYLEDYVTTLVSPEEVEDTIIRA